jgi:hypothetical protein
VSGPRSAGAHPISPRLRKILSPGKGCAPTVSRLLEYADGASRTGSVGKPTVSCHKFTAENFG